MTAGTFNRERVPDWLRYAEMLGIAIEGRGTWRSILCDFHDDTHASLRVKTTTGGWACMACGATGGDTLAHYMRRTGLDFVKAAKSLGAWDEYGTGPVKPHRARTLSHRDGLELLYADAAMLWILACDIAQGKTLTECERTSAAGIAQRSLVIFEGCNP